eukprot:403366622
MKNLNQSSIDFDFQQMRTIHQLKVNKRAVYYSLIDSNIGSTMELDGYISEICLILSLHRDDLLIKASSKGLMFGGGIDSDLSEELLINQLQIPSLTDEQFYEKILPKLKAKVVLLVEKDTVFSRLTQQQYFIQNREHILLLTGKGYPDYATKRFVKMLSQIAHLPILYLGDADSFGADIYFQYAFGNQNSSVDQDDINCPLIQWIGPFMQDFKDIKKQDLSEKDKLKIYSLLTKPYFKNYSEQECHSEIHKSILKNLQLYKGHLILMERENKKFEIEALTVVQNELNLHEDHHMDENDALTQLLTYYIDIFLNY